MEGLFSLLLFALFFYVMMRFGCGAHMIHGGHGQHTAGSGDSTDPVCGMQVSADSGYTKMHQGTQYRFCSRSCLDKFDANPQQYLKKEPS
ncbi:MAG: YHS domain-containing protein [Pseudomonadota bacterium]